MKEMTCIVCPNGCRLKVEETKDGVQITGNKCKRGYHFAINELEHPMRTICSTVQTTFKNVPVVPVRVSKEIPKEKIFDIMKEINKVVVTKKMKTGDVVIKNVLGLGADVIITSNKLEGESENE